MPQQYSNPGLAQQRAADPAAHVWVNASAGSGKTKVLVDRLLRLLLGERKIPAAAPDRILCITFTRAAAAEMQQRLQERLMHWAVISETELQAALTDLTGTRPDAKFMQRARGLWQVILDASPPLRIQTIHSLAQSILAQFPLEAGVMPFFNLMDDLQGEILRQQAFQQLRTDPAHMAALQRVQAQNASADTLQKNLWRAAKMTAQPAVTTLNHAFDLPSDTNLHAPMQIELTAPQKQTLQTLLQGLLATTQGEQKLQQAIINWLETMPLLRAVLLPLYAESWLTQAGEPRKNLVAAASLKKNPALADLAQQAVANVLVWLQQSQAQNAASLTADWLQLGQTLRAQYTVLKRRQHVLDYDDLIEHAVQLLQDPIRAAWVLYKLDGGLDHLLVDEAQDTSPNQWAIITALCSEFWAGASARRNHRTLFVVGDFKQSIYSFQGANPQLTAQVRDEISVQAIGADQNWRLQPLTHSFRSTPPILQVIDAVFADPVLAHAVTLGSEIVQHTPQQIGAGGDMALWPLFTRAEKTAEMPWALDDAEQTTHPVTQLAERVANTIMAWLSSGAKLPASGRLILPADIMIIARKRAPLLEACRTALQARHIPVAADDQLQLLQELAVQDCLSFMRWCVDPDDDLALAEILKGPLFNWSEEQLFELAHGREGKLWLALNALTLDSIASGGLVAVCHYLSDWKTQAALLSPAQFLLHWLQAPCFTAVSGWQAFRAVHGNAVVSLLQQLLQLAEKYMPAENAHITGFLAWCADKSDFKLKQGNANVAAIRLLTVHGAKGMEAPIVFVLDDLLAASKGWRLEDDWLPADAAVPFPRYVGGIKSFNPQLAAAFERQRAAYIAEHWRLLYVALTRAQERLIVAGYGNENADASESWFAAVQSGLARLPNTQDMAGTTLYALPHLAAGGAFIDR